MEIKLKNYEVIEVYRRRNWRKTLGRHKEILVNMNENNWI